MFKDFTRYFSNFFLWGMWKYKCEFIKKLTPLLKMFIFFGPAQQKWKLFNVYFCWWFFISLCTYYEFAKSFNSKNGHIFSNFQGFKFGLNFLYDPNCSSKTNGWIYSCFEPVFIEKEGNICFQDKTSNSNSYVLCQKALSRSGCFVDYLNAKSNFLNALNLMASSDRGNLLRGIAKGLHLTLLF